MANEKVKVYETKIYNRKIERNKIKNQLKTNRIKNVWHRLQNKDHYTHINKQKAKEI